MISPPGSAPDGVGGVVKLNPRAEPFIQTISKTRKQHRRGKREDGENPGSKQQIRPRQGGWTGRCGAGRPNLSRETKIPCANVGRAKRISVCVRTKNAAENRKIQAKKKRLQGRAERRREGKRSVEARASARPREITIATHNVRTMAVDGTHGVGRALEVLSVYNDLSCDVIGLQETRRAGQTILREAKFVVYCSGESGGDGENKDQEGVRLAVRTQIIRAAARPPKFHQRSFVKGDVQTVW